MRPSAPWRVAAWRRGARHRGTGASGRRGEGSDWPSTEALPPDCSGCKKGNSLRFRDKQPLKTQRESAGAPRKTRFSNDRYLTGGLRPRTVAVLALPACQPAGSGRVAQLADCYGRFVNSVACELSRL